MSVLIKDLSLKQYLDFMYSAYGEKCLMPNENEKLTLMGCDIIEVRAVQVNIENDFKYFGEPIVYACYPIQKGGTK